MVQTDLELLGMHSDTVDTYYYYCYYNSSGHP